jgi:hypothetical protein
VGVEEARTQFFHDANSVFHFLREAKKAFPQRRRIGLEGLEMKAPQFR